MATSCVVVVDFPKPGDNGNLNVRGELVGEDDVLPEKRVSIVAKAKEFDGKATLRASFDRRGRIIRGRGDSPAQCIVRDEFWDKDAAIPEAHVVVAWAGHS